LAFAPAGFFFAAGAVFRFEFAICFTLCHSAVACYSSSHPVQQPRR
jgi:hypothetical protein